MPFSTPLSFGAQPGRLIQVNGHVPPHSNKFDFNLQQGGGILPPNVIFHASIRFDEMVIVRNSCRFGQWGLEERHGEPVPFNRGAPFELLILIEPNEIKMAVNGRHYAALTHRAPLHEATHFAVNGDIQVTSVRQF